VQGSPETTKQHPQKSKEDTRLTWPIDPTTVVLQTHSIIAMSVVVLMRYEIGFQQLSIRTNGRPAIFLVLQVFSWVDARLSRTQPRGTRTRTRTRKRLNRFKSISPPKKQAIQEANSLPHSPTSPKIVGHASGRLAPWPRSKMSSTHHKTLPPRATPNHWSSGWP
jgi:hypothetical protein